MLDSIMEFIKTFVMLFFELFVLFIIVSFIVSIIQQIVSEEKIKQFLSKPNQAINYILGMTFGAMTLTRLESCCCLLPIRFLYGL